MSAPAIRLVIDRLVLRGVDRADGAAVQRALAAELRSMLIDAGPDALGGSASRPRFSLSIAAEASPHMLGRSAGRAISRALYGPGTKSDMRPAVSVASQPAMASPQVARADAPGRVRRQVDEDDPAKRSRARHDSRSAADASRTILNVPDPAAGVVPRQVDVQAEAVQQAAREIATDRTPAGRAGPSARDIFVSSADPLAPVAVNAGRGPGASSKPEAKGPYVEPRAAVQSRDMVPSRLDPLPPERPGRKAEAESPKGKKPPIARIITGLRKDLIIGKGIAPYTQTISTRLEQGRTIYRCKNAVNITIVAVERVGDNEYDLTILYLEDVFFEGAPPKKNIKKGQIRKFRVTWP